MLGIPLHCAQQRQQQLPELQLQARDHALPRPRQIVLVRHGESEGASRSGRRCTGVASLGGGAAWGRRARELVDRRAREIQA